MMLIVTPVLALAGFIIGLLLGIETESERHRRNMMHAKERISRSTKGVN